MKVCGGPAVLTLLLSCASQQVLITTLDLDGTPASFLKFPKLPSCGPNASLSFDFLTADPSGLLLYSGIGGTSIFLELRIVYGALVLRYNHGAGPHMVSIGDYLNDDKWHSVTIIRSASSSSSLVLDTNARGYHPDCLSIAEEASLYFGGVPESFLARLDALPLPSIPFERHFRGSVRGVVRSGCGRERERLVGVEREGVRTNNDDSCADHDPCQNGGECLSTDMGPFCDCARTLYNGTLCHTERSLQELTLLGHEYLSYDLSRRGAPIVGRNDVIRLDFLSSKPDGLLFYTGDGDDFVLAALHSGALHVRISRRGGSAGFETELKPESTPATAAATFNGSLGFDDNRWHTLAVSRESRELAAFRGICYITIQVDAGKKHTGTIVGEFKLFSSSLMLVGGTSRTSAPHNTAAFDNFRGCLRRIIYQSDSVYLDLLDLSRREYSFVESHGVSLFNTCENDLSAIQPISFQTEDSYIELEAPVRKGVGSGVSGAFSIQFHLRTTEPTGLVFYGVGMKPASCLIAFELLEGALHLLIDLGTGVYVYEAGHTRVDDGLPHQVALAHDGGKGRLRLDDQEKLYAVPGYSGRERIMLDGGAFVGGLSAQHADLLQADLWSLGLQPGYVGCLSELTLNSDRVNLVALSRDQEVLGVLETCVETTPLCPRYPCLHGGACREGWGRFVCDCAATSFRGPTCRQPAVVVGFNGTQSVLITLPSRRRAPTDDISVRLRTGRPSGLILVAGGGPGGPGGRDCLEVGLSEGRVKVVITLDAESQTLFSGQSLDDDRWHTVYIKRRGALLDLSVDNSSRSRVEFPATHRTLTYSRIEVGQRTPRSRHSARSARQQQHAEPRPIRAQNLVTSSTTPGFVGKLQQLRVNGKEYFELLRAGGLGDGRGEGRGEGKGEEGGEAEGRGVESTALVDRSQGGPLNPMTIGSQEAYLVTKLKIHSTFNIHLQLKTTQMEGLLLYAGEAGKDFLALELASGHLRYSYDVGSRPRVVLDTLRRGVSDNRWHEVALLHPSLERHVLRVDDSVVMDTLPDARSVHFDMADELYVGGVERGMYAGLPKLVTSRVGFQGCLAAVDLDGDSRSLRDQGAAVPAQYQDDVLDGCEGPKLECDETSCHNGGRCVQEWNTFFCDCDLTSFTGPSCSEDGVAYRFGSKGGLIGFTFQQGERIDTRHDRLAFGLVTTQRDAVLMRVVSGNSNDYLELEVRDGNVFAVYNMGMTDHPLGDLSAKVNDGNYHVIRFTRVGPNSTLQLDGFPEQFKYPSGRQLHTFNNIAHVYVGGKRDTMGRSLKSFTGTIAGIVLNGQKLLDLAAEGDSRVKIEGDVELETKPLRPYPVTMPSSSVRSNTKSTSSLTTLKMVDKIKVTDCSKKDAGCTSFPNSTADAFSLTTKPFNKKPPSASSDKYPLVTNPPLDAPDNKLCLGPDDDCAPHGSSSHHGDSKNASGTTHNPKNPETGKPTLPSLSLMATTDPQNTTEMKPTLVTKALGNATAVKMPPSSRNASGNDQRFGGFSGTSLAIIVGASAGVLILLLLLAFAVYKYRSRDEGSYKIDETNNYGYEACNSKPLAHMNGRVRTKHKRKDVEWYV